MTCWRLIDSGRCSASFNMALDEAVSTSVRKEGLPPTLRLYGWERPAVSLGCFQRASDIDLDYCRGRGIQVVRRPTGGRAILHGDELTYSLSARFDTPLFSHGLLDSYRRISKALWLALRRAGLEAVQKGEREKGHVLSGSPLCFRSSSYGELLAEGGKIVGSAQKRWEDGLLQQGSAPYMFDAEATIRIFGETAAGGEGRLKGLRQMIPWFSEDGFRKAVVAAFEEVFSIRLVQSPPEPEEEALALLLQDEKYLRPEWTLKR